MIDLITETFAAVIGVALVLLLYTGVLLLSILPFVLTYRVVVWCLP